MIVLGAGTHERSQTIAAVSAASGELTGERAVRVGAKGASPRLSCGRAGSAANGCGRWGIAGTSRARSSGL
jgi:hypothetical protein